MSLQNPYASISYLQIISKNWARFVFWKVLSSLQTSSSSKVNWMSLTLRDAQHLSWKTFRKFENQDKSRSASFDSATELLKKAGEIADKIKILQNSDSLERGELAKMFSELLFSLFVLSERYDVNLEDSFLQAVDELIMGFVS
jgi:hypothetical protein